MNKVVLVGRLTADPDVRYSQTSDSQMAIARFNLAVDRKIKRENEQNADFISCVAFGKTAEFIEKYFSKGMRIGLSGHIQTGSYTNQNGVKVYTTDVIIDECEFVESKKEQNTVPELPPAASDDGFMNIDDDGITEQLPFN